MWKIKSDGTLAVDDKNDSTVRIAFCSDKIYRVKKNYKTIGTFTTMADAKNFLADTVKKWNGDNYEQV